MNFLPFVFTFLLILTTLSSFLFSSVIGTVRENKLILLQHRTYLQLLSKQNEDLFKTKEKDKKSDSKEGVPEKSKKNITAQEKDPEPRSVHDGLEKSKLNLFALMDGKNPQLTQFLEQITVHLLDTLYGRYDFYKPAFGKDIAHTIVQQMMKDPIESLEEINFEKNKELDPIYYKMLKGTNTGYPSLKEYLRVSKDNLSPVYFRYASKPVLEAVLGEESAKIIIDTEIKNWRENKLRKALPKEKCLELIKAKSVLPSHLIDKILDFSNKNKGVSQIHQVGGEKIRAINSV
jgi:hypothetical protein